MNPLRALIPLLLFTLSLAGQSPAVLLFGGGTPFPPQPSDLVLWLKPETLSGANGVVVSNWPDSSGLGNNFTNTPTTGPILSNSLVNGKSGVRFLGSTTSYLKNNNAFMSSATTGEVFAVVRATASPSAAGKYVMWDFANKGGSGNAAHPFTDSAIYETFGSKQQLAGVPLTNFFYPTNWHIYDVATTTNYMLLKYNGNLIGGMDVVTSGWSNSFRLGLALDSVNSWDGEMAEVMIYTNFVTDTSRAAIQNYLSVKYNITGLTNAAQTYSPTNYGGLLGWWDASTIGSNNNDLVAQWNDQTQFTNHWFQSLTGFMPTFHTNIFNGLPALWLNPAKSNYMFLTAATGLSMTNFWTIIAVHQITNDSRDLLFVGFSPFPQLRYRSGGVNAMLMNNGASSVTSSTGPQPVGQLQMDVMFRSSTTLGGFAMNAANQTFNSGNGAGPYRINLLSINDPTLAYGGHVAEICIYTNVLSIDQLAKLYYTYFRPKWGLP